MHRACRQMVLKMLSPEQKVAWVSMPSNLIEMVDAYEHFLEKIVTGDEK